MRWFFLFVLLNLFKLIFYILLLIILITFYLVIYFNLLILHYNIFLFYIFQNLLNFRRNIWKYLFIGDKKFFEKIFLILILILIINFILILQILLIFLKIWCVFDWYFLIALNFSINLFYRAFILVFLFFL